MVLLDLKHDGAAVILALSEHKHGPGKQANLFKRRSGVEPSSIADPFIRDIRPDCQRVIHQREASEKRGFGADGCFGHVYGGEVFVGVCGVVAVEVKLRHL